ncbi:hypothetical protein QYF36_000989 [Acer negundo]|nr:hypothetical protein QYF36_000989 [Acer negundo]
MEGNLSQGGLIPGGASFDDEDPSFTEEADEGHNDANKGKMGLKWTDKMVRLFITAVSCIGKKDKWKGTSCRVVENPALLDVIDYLTEKEKDNVRKILFSRHLINFEICSYHNAFPLRSRDDHDNDDPDEGDQDMETDDHGEFEFHFLLQISYALIN